MFKMDADISATISREAYLSRCHISVPIVVAFGFFTPCLEYVECASIANRSTHIHTLSNVEVSVLLPIVVVLNPPDSPTYDKFPPSVRLAIAALM